MALWLPPDSEGSEKNLGSYFGADDVDTTDTAAQRHLENHFRSIDRSFQRGGPLHWKSAKRKHEYVVSFGTQPITHHAWLGTRPRTEKNVGKVQLFCAIGFVKIIYMYVYIYIFIFMYIDKIAFIRSLFFWRKTLIFRVFGPVFFGRNGTKDWLSWADTLSRSERRQNGQSIAIIEAQSRPNSKKTAANDEKSTTTTTHLKERIIIIIIIIHNVRIIDFLYERCTFTAAILFCGDAIISFFSESSSTYVCMYVDR